MREMGACQMAQMKHRDARVFVLCQHWRSVIDIFEQINADAYRRQRGECRSPRLNLSRHHRGSCRALIPADAWLASQPPVSGAS